MSGPAGGSTWYEVLGVPQNASQKDIQDAYRKLARQHHPDVVGGGNSESFVSIQDAYDVLRDPAKRTQYDASLATGPVAPEEPVDDWVTNRGWDDEPVDTEVVEDDTPPSDTYARQQKPASSPAVNVPPPPSSDLARVDDDCAPTWAIGLGWVIAWALPAILGPMALLIGGVIAIALATAHFTGSVTTLVPLPRWARKALPLLLALTGVAIVVGGLFTKGNAIWSLMLLLAGETLAAALAGSGLIWRSTLNKTVPRNKLRNSNLFGTPPGGVAPAELSDALTPLLDWPTIRIIRFSEDKGFFSHAVVNGNKVAILRAHVAPGGAYNWSGPSLLMTPPNGVRTELLRGNWQRAVAAIRAALAQVEADAEFYVVVFPADKTAVTVTGSPEPGYPTVVDGGRHFQEVIDYLTADQTGDVVRRDIFAATYRAVQANNLS